MPVTAGRDPMGLLNFLRLPEARNVADLDDPAVTALHGRIIRRKPFLRKIYQEIYHRFKAALRPGHDRAVVELGSGAGFLKEVIPQAITSDVLGVPGLTARFSALALPFADASLDAILMIDVLHHLPDVARFLREADRCLRKGGRILMVEPANTLWARFVYTHFHHEPFQPAADWKLDGAGPLSSANGAIPWIVFCRDRARFDREFPRLRLVAIRPHMPFRYLLSGGVSIRQLAPSFAYSLIKGLECLLSPLNRFLGMFYFITVEKL
jgi:SAM-dependent methyltransferase